MIEKSKSGVSIIGGADGPTSIFIAGKIQKKSLKVKIRRAIYKHKHKRAEKKNSCRCTYTEWIGEICTE